MIRSTPRRFAETPTCREAVELSKRRLLYEEIVSRLQKQLAPVSEAGVLSRRSQGCSPRTWRLGSFRV